MLLILISRYLFPKRSVRRKERLMDEVARERSSNKAAIPYILNDVTDILPYLIFIYFLINNCTFFATLSLLHVSLIFIFKNYCYFFTLHMELRNLGILGCLFQVN